MVRKIVWGVLVAGAMPLGIGSTVSRAEEAVDFNRDVRPILADKCFHCHGPDAGNRKGELRLDTADGAAAALHVAKPSDGEFLRRITSTDPDTRMPPTESNFTKRLSPAEIAMLKRWVESGAKYAKHWALEKPKKSEPPQIANGVAPPTWKNDDAHVIDRFIAAALAKAKLKPTSRADKATLLRRVTLDLTGLPPTLAELDAFLRDESPGAFETVVERLLKSPRYGERMTLAWMDLARYGDSSVYHADGPRDMWAWRDWVIQAFTDNMPFDQFTVEQIAGDLLPNASVSQKVASGFNRNHATTDEGGVIPEEFRVDYVVDRVKTVSNTWLAMSFECGQCHDHKYDPLTQREYYQFYAFFNNTKDGGMQTRNGNSPPLVEVADPEANAKRSAAEEIRKQSLERLKQHRAAVAKSKPYQDWLTARSGAKDGEKSADKSASAATLLDKLALLFPLDEVANTATVSALDDTAANLEGRFQPAGRPDGNGVKFAGNVGAAFADGLELEGTQPFTFAAWLKLNKQDGGYLLAKMNNSKNFQGYDFGTEGLRPGIHVIHQWPNNALKVYAKQEMSPNAWHHVVISHDGSGKAAGVKIYVDGELQENNVTADALQGSIKNPTPLRLGSRSDGPKFKGEVDDLAVWNRELTADEVKVAGQDFFAAVKLLPEEIRTAGQNDLLLSYYLRTVDKQQSNLIRELAKASDDIRKSEKGAVSVMVMEDMPANQMRTTFILNRGQYDQPQKDKQVEPGTPAAFPPFPADAPKNRLGLAKWLVSPDHPLTARVAVNRIWQLFFGEGLVRSTEDFGLQGEMPSHPELLDWLAVDFVEHGWDVKRLVKQIVFSETYQQSSRAEQAALTRDPENRLLSHAPRFRLQGEFIRDNALLISGLFVEKIGGPSVRPYQPKGIWEEVALDTNLSKYVQDHGEKLYRRSMYIYWKRSAPHPSLQIFDAPTREKCIGRRPRTNTPLQALVTLNDPQFVEAARAFAQQILLEGGSSAESRIDFAIRTALGRAATSREQSLLRQLVESQTIRFQKSPDNAVALLKIGESPREEKIPATEHATWTVLANTVLNTDEFLMRN